MSGQFGPPIPSAVLHTMFRIGLLMSHGLHCAQFDALICRR
jgi:hypothetical protein